MSGMIPNCIPPFKKQKKKNNNIYVDISAFVCYSFSMLKYLKILMLYTPLDNNPTDVRCNGMFSVRLKRPAL